MGNLQLVPQGWLARNFDVTQGGAPVAQIVSHPSWRQKATLTVNGATYRAFREHFAGGDYLLEEEGGKAVARSRKLGAFSSSMRVECFGHVYTLKKKYLMARTFLLLDGSREVGVVKPQGMLTRRAEVFFPDEIPLPVQVFILWLVVALWKQESDSAVFATRLR